MKSNWLRAFVIEVMLSACVWGQNPTPKHTAMPDTTIFSEGVDMGSDTVKIFEDDKHQATFQMTTSWIPGEGHKGFIRYRVSATGIGLTLKEAPPYIERLHKCDITAILYDSGKFVLRRIPLIFMRGVADSGDVVEMNANDLDQMDLAEYRRFISKGSWQVSWVCPE
jgi:hypothetical protein